MASTCPKGQLNPLSHNIHPIGAFRISRDHKFLAEIQVEGFEIESAECRKRARWRAAVYLASQEVEEAKAIPEAHRQMLFCQSLFWACPQHRQWSSPLPPPPMELLLNPQPVQTQRIAFSLGPRAGFMVPLLPSALPAASSSWSHLLTELSLLDQFALIWNSSCPKYRRKRLFSHSCHPVSCLNSMPSVLVSSSAPSGSLCANSHLLHGDTAPNRKEWIPCLVVARGRAHKLAQWCNLESLQQGGKEGADKMGPVEFRPVSCFSFILYHQFCLSSRQYWTENSKISLCLLQHSMSIWPWTSPSTVVCLLQQTCMDTLLLP